MDAYVSEIIAVVDEKRSDDLDKIVEQLKTCGVEVSNINKDENVIEGCVESQKLKDIGKVPGVEYVRTVFTYAANYPPGDPRDRDGV
jgi:hypothetical protein